tara:strand:+ start:4256 stop:4483 length:228 start_codon:yes stop_codon:yes gene_type:complete
MGQAKTIDTHLIKQQGKLELIEKLIEMYEMDTKRYPGMKEYHQDPLAICRTLKHFKHNVAKWIKGREKMNQKETA